MKIWPVFDSCPKIIPRKNERGCFWENRGDRFHCGIDLYTKVGSTIVNIYPGIVIDTGIFTSSNIISYWNKTYYVDVKFENNLFCRYAEMSSINVKKGDILSANEKIGEVGQVLNKDKIANNSPLYIKKLVLVESNIVSMLHFELYDIKPIDLKNKYYLGGNWFGKSKPKGLLDPSIIL